MRIIDADALADNIAVLFERNKALIDEWLMYNVEDAIDEAPTIDAEPVRHGRWKYVKAYKGAEFGFYQCSVCGDPWWFTMKYCANCGAKMDSNDSNDSNALNALEMDEVNDGNDNNET